MHCSINNVRRIMTYDEYIPDGEFQGIWSAYIVSFTTPYGSYEANALLGVRGTVPCTVTVDQGKITART